MLSELAAWWRDQMLDLLPRRMRSAGRSRRNTLFVEPADSAARSGWAAVQLFRQGKRGERALGRFALDEPGIDAMRGAVRAAGRPDQVVLRIEHSSLLEQQIVLPLAAERGVGQVLLHDMDRVTPFRSDAVFWDWAIERRDRARARLHVRLTLLPRAGLEPLMRRLGDAGIAPALIATSAADGSPRWLSAGQHAAQQPRAQRHATRAAAIVCASLAIVAVALPFVLQSLAIGRVERRIAALQPDVALAEGLRRRIAARAVGVDALAAERARSGDAVVALAAITEILPDTTFLSAFSLAQRQIAMTGQSNEAARLISTLSSDPAIRNPSFAAPVTRVPGSGADQFSIRAELAP